jgi:hypothetical protein
MPPANGSGPAPTGTPRRTSGPCSTRGGGLPTRYRVPGQVAQARTQGGAGCASTSRRRDALSRRRWEAALASMERPEEGEAGGRPPRAPSVGQELLQLRIHRHRRQLAPELEEHLIHKLPKPGEASSWLRAAGPFFWTRSTAVGLICRLRQRRYWQGAGAVPPGHHGPKEQNG